MPDLFHFMQDLSKTVGARLGNGFKKAQKRLAETNCESADYDQIREELLIKQKRLESYRKCAEQINGLVHPFNESDCLAEQEEINTCLLYTSPSPRDATLSRMPSSA